MEKATKLLAICFLIGSLLISLSILFNERYEVYPKDGIAYSILLDKLTGNVKLITHVDTLKLKVIPIK